MNQNLPRWVNWGVGSIFVFIVLGILAFSISPHSGGPTPFNGYNLTGSDPFYAVALVMLMKGIFSPAIFICKAIGSSTSGIILQIILYALNAFAVGAILGLIFKKRTS